MSSTLFQPLLHDPLGWKQSTTTYNDTFKSRCYGTSSNKEKKLSPYGQDYQKQLRKQQQQMKLFRTNPYFTQSISDEQPTPRIIYLKKNNEEYREQPPASYQFTRSKTLPVVCEEPPNFAAEYKKPVAPIYREPNYGSASLQHLPTVPSDQRGPMKVRRNPQEDREKHMIDINDDRHRHWLTYPTPDTPPQIVDIKQRLNQYKVPQTLSRATSASYACEEQQSGSNGPHRRKKQHDDRGHFLESNIPPTPPELRAARHRLEKHRYHQSLDNYPPQQENNQGDDDQDEYSRPANASQYEDEQSPPDQTTSTKEEYDESDDENRLADYEQSTMMGQTNNDEKLPEEYIEALEISDAAQEEYYKNCKPYCEKSFYRIPPIPSDHQHDSAVAYCSRQQQQPTNYNNNSRNGNEFGAWIRNSTDHERESAMKILNNVLKEPTIGYGIPKKKQIIFKRPGGCNSARAGSPIRQLGHTRNHQRIPCEICEKQLIKHHIWSLSRSKTLACPHQE